MRVLGMRTSTKSNGFVTRFKTNVEPGDHSMYKVISSSLEFEITNESEICDSAGREIDIEDTVRISDDGFEIDGVDQRLSHCDSCNGREVEAIHRFPESDLFFLVVCVFNTGNV